MKLKLEKNDVFEWRIDDSQRDAEKNDKLFIAIAANFVNCWVTYTTKSRNEYVSIN